MGLANVFACSQDTPCCWPCPLVPLAPTCCCARRAASLLLCVNGRALGAPRRCCTACLLAAPRLVAAEPLAAPSVVIEPSHVHAGLQHARLGLGAVSPNCRRERARPSRATGLASSARSLHRAMHAGRPLDSAMPLSLRRCSSSLASDWPLPYCDGVAMLPSFLSPSWLHQAPLPPTLAPCLCLLLAPAEPDPAIIELSLGRVRRRAAAPNRLHLAAACCSASATSAPPRLELQLPSPVLAR